MYKYLLLLHILSATIWTGGHILLSLVILPQAFREKTIAKLVEFEEGFEKIGIPALLIQVTTGIWMALIREPSIAAWFKAETLVTKLLLWKLSLLLLTVLLALDARLRLIPKLDESKLTSLAFHIVPVTLLSIIFVIVGVAFRVGGFP